MRNLIRQSGLIQIDALVHRPQNGLRTRLHTQPNRYATSIMHHLKQFTIQHIHTSATIPSHIQLPRMQLLTNLHHTFSINRECIIIKRNLVNAVFVVHKLHLINDVLGTTPTITSATHSHSTAQVTPINATTTSNQGKKNPAHSLQSLKWQQVMRWKRQ